MQHHDYLSIHFMHLDEIEIPEDRQRKHFAQKPLDELQTSILEKGLINPITVRTLEDRYLLSSGERRYRAISELDEPYTFGGSAISPGTIPCIILDELTEIQAKEIELEENIQREDLTWQERTAAEAELHKLRTQQAEARGEKQTLKDTTNEIYGGKTTNTGALKDSLLLSEALESGDEEISKAGSKKEAMKILTKKNEQLLREELALKQGEKKRENLEFIHGDCLTHLPGERFKERFTCIVADPPYNVGAHAFRNYNSYRKHKYEDTDFDIENFLTVAYYVMLPDAHMYLWCGAGWEMTYEVAQQAVTSGFNVWKWPMIWNKTHHTLVPDQYRGPGRQYETILFCTKGDLKVNSIRPDLITQAGDRDKIHSAQKPVDLTRDLLSRSCVSGDEVLIPFAGSGNEVIAALRENLIVTALEKDEEHHRAAQANIIHELGENPDD